MIKIGKFPDRGKKSVVYTTREGNKKDNFFTMEDLGAYMRRRGTIEYDDLYIFNAVPSVEPLSHEEKMLLRRFYEFGKPTDKTRR